MTLDVEKRKALCNLIISLLTMTEMESEGLQNYLIPALLVFLNVEPARFQATPTWTLY